ncbi:MAG TPA: hypothetical protein VNO31_45535 [Umezawaea sp.]|nr:hypothetical protein [Umezawaea sp.]
MRVPKTPACAGAALPCDWSAKGPESPAPPHEQPGTSSADHPEPA